MEVCRLVRKRGRDRSREDAEKVNYFKVAWFLFQVNNYVFKTVRRGDMPQIKSLTEQLREVIKKQKAARDIQDETIKKQEKAKIEPQIATTTQKLGEV